MRNMYANRVARDDDMLFSHGKERESAMMASSGFTGTVFIVMTLATKRSSVSNICGSHEVDHHLRAARQGSPRAVYINTPSR